jgi:hypothetical protein
MGQISTPNLLLGLVRVAAWLFWRDPPVAESRPKKPRRPTLDYTVSTTPEHLLAVVRICWFKRGKASEVEEYQIESCPDAVDSFHYLVGQALRHGADVSVMTELQPEILGVPVE